MKKILWAVCVFATAVAAAGCETVKGIGRDITGASSTIQESMSHGRNS